MEGSQEMSRCRQCRTDGMMVDAFTNISTQDHRFLNLQQGNLNTSAVSDSHWNMICKFYKELEKLQRETCSVCLEHWYDMKIKIQDSVATCARCRVRDKTQNGQERVALMSAANNMDPGPYPAYLPALTQVKEMLIARAHVAIQIRRIRGHQYQYSGHVVHFMQNTAKITNQLPWLPSELDILILKPAGATESENSLYHRQFQKDFKVRRRSVQIWLEYLCEHHPDYGQYQVTLRRNRLNQLPEDGSVIDQVATIIEPESDQSELDITARDQVLEQLLDEDVIDDHDERLETGMVPNISGTQSETEVDLIRHTFQGLQSRFSMGTI